MHSFVAGYLNSLQFLTKGGCLVSLWVFLPLETFNNQICPLKEFLLCLLVLDSLSLKF